VVTRASWRKSLSSGEMYGFVKGDMELVDVRILVLRGLMAMSRRSMALVGAAVLRWHSRSAIVEYVMKSEPLGMPIPNWPWGRRNSAASVPSTVSHS
jgi:hypothetical protein